MEINILAAGAGENQGIEIALLWLVVLKYEHGGIRTPDPQNRNLMLYPLSYMPLSMLEL